MSGIGDILKPIVGAAWHSEKPTREAVTQLYVLGVQSIINEKPLVKRFEDHNLVTWKEGQAKKMEKYISSLIWKMGKPSDKAGAPSKEFSLSEVQLDLKPVIFPLALKTIVPFIGVYTLGMFFLGRSSRRK